MIYELKGRLLTLTSEQFAEWKQWHKGIVANLKQLHPDANGYWLRTSVMHSDVLSGVSSDVDLGKGWKKREGTNQWVPDRRFRAGKIAASVIAKIPPEPDTLLAIMKELGFESRYFQLESEGYKISSPGLTYLPLISRAFVIWNEQYPEVDDVDMVEVLSSSFKSACKENDELKERS